jgi:hypothetical protein
MAVLGLPVGAQVAILAAVGLTVVWLGARSIRAMLRGDPEKRERKRRRLLYQRGRLAEAYVTDADQTTLYYSYSVGGVQYQASQDISTLRAYLPGPPERVLGVANVKYSLENPANSMLVCEDWCGVRVAQAAPEARLQAAP